MTNRSIQRFLISLIAIICASSQTGWAQGLSPIEIYSSSRKKQLDFEHKRDLCLTNAKTADEAIQSAEQLIRVVLLELGELEQNLNLVLTKDELTTLKAESKAWTEFYKLEHEHLTRLCKRTMASSVRVDLRLKMADLVICRYGLLGGQLAVPRQAPNPPLNADAASK